MTVGIVVSALLLAIVVPSVTIVWSIMGSSVSLVIAYILPSACYLRIRSKKVGWNQRKVGSVVILFVASIMCVM